MKVLAISTSTRRGGAALLDDGRVLAARTWESGEGSAERLFKAIDACAREAGLEVLPADATLACDVGPGSFTGVRVGVASVEGIALALGLATVGVVSLEAMAAAAFGEGLVRNGVVVAAIDAKKDEAFLAAYDAQGSAVLSPCHVALAGVADLLARDSRTAGAPVVGEIAASIAALSSRVVRADSADLPDAAWVGRVALARLARGADPRELRSDLEPLYVRAPDAKPQAAAGGVPSAR